MKPTQLPNGLTILELNTHETNYVYDEIFVQRVYARHKIVLESNAVIFDIGANIGLFSLYAAQEFPHPKLYCFEPVPHCLEVLSKNLAPLGEQVKIFGTAMGSTQGATELTFYPGHTIMSSIVADFERDQHTLLESIRTDYESKTGLSLEERLAYMLAIEKLDSSIKFKCPVTTFSAVMDAENITSVALAKIDVECAEKMILDGIEERHWPCIERFVIEVHDQGNNEPQRMRDRLLSKGYDVILSLSPHLATSGIFELFAERR